MKAGKYTGMGEYELDVTYIKNKNAPLSTEEIKILKKEKVLAEKQVIVENVEEVKYIYVENEWKDTIIHVGMVAGLFFALLIVCVCIYIQK